MNLSFRHFYWRWSRNLVFLMLLVLAFLSLARLGFASYFSDFKILMGAPADFCKSLLLGLRFDLVPLAYINALPFIILNLSCFLPGIPVKISRPLIIGSLFTGYCLLSWIYLFDYSFYSYFQDHLNVLSFGFFEDDTNALLITLWKNYNLPLYIPLFFVFQIGLFKLIKFLFSPYDFDLKVKERDYRMPLNFVLGLILLVLFARGNFTRLPFSVDDAHFSSNEFFNKLSLNGVLTLNRAIKIRKTYGKGEYDYLSRYGYDKDWKKAFSDAFNKAPTQELLANSLLVTIPGKKNSRPHVVLIVMESFGSYWNQFDAVDFNLLGDLRDHFKEGLLFNNFLPAENGTIGSFVSVATSQVIRPGSRFLSESDLMKTRISSSGHLPYKEAGYDTHFVYGGKLGWRDLGQFLTVQRYDHLWGAEEIKEAMPELNNIQTRDLGNEWGIFDEYLYIFLEERLRTASKPQFFLVLTTSNHPPFEYPTTYRPAEVRLREEILSQLSTPTEIAMKRFLGLQYANQKTAEFLSRIKNSTLKNKVVTALTGDHSYWIAKGVGSESEFKRYAVPFFISLPDHLRPSKVDLARFGSHEDIFPSLLSLTLPGSRYVKLGESLFEEESHAMNSSGLVANKKGAYHHGKYWKWKNLKDQILEPVADDGEMLSLKAHQEGLISITDLYLKQEKVNKHSAEESDQLE